RFVAAWKCIPTSPPNRTVQVSCDEKIIVRVSAAAQYAPVPFDPPCHTNHDHRRTNGLTGFAANDGDIKTRCGAIETAVELIHPRCFFFTSDRQVTKRKFRHS